MSNDDRTPDTDAEQEPLCFLLAAAARATANAYRPGLAGLGLTFPQFGVLVVLSGSDGLGMADLATRLHLDASTLTPLVRRMERAGLVQRCRSRSDERRVTIHLTDAGRDLLVPSEEVACEVASRLTLSAAEAEMLRELAHRIIGAYDPPPLRRAQFHRANTTTEPNTPTEPTHKESTCPAS